MMPGRGCQACAGMEAPWGGGIAAVLVLATSPVPSQVGAAGESERGVSVLSGKWWLATLNIFCLLRRFYQAGKGSGTCQCSRLGTDG